MTKQFRGAGVALITPFNQDKSIDFQSLEKLIDFQIAEGTNYIVALGTTGEPATLSKQEKQELIAFIAQKINKRVPFVVGCGGNNTSETIETVTELNKNELIDALLVITPYYNRPSQNGLFEHFKAVAAKTSKPVILYNVPSRTGVNMTTETTLKLAKECKNIIGVKEASGNLSQAMQMAKQRPEGFLLISGDDALTLPLMACGFDGVISVLSNAYPGMFSRVVKFALEGDFKSAREIHYQLIDIIDTLFEEGSPCGVKAYLAIQKRAQNAVRLPIVPVSESLFHKIEKLASN
jgi:4-hydroxy-tetrahydrodipicolinate synthase